MNKKELLEEVNTVSRLYHSRRLAGINELYHIAVRDHLIVKGGGVSALELGCGGGLWTRILCNLYDKLDIVDGSQELLQRVAKDTDGCHAKIVMHHMLIEDFVEQSEGKWEHIYITFLLEHLVEPVKVLERLRNRLDKGGRLLVAVPNARSVHRVLAHRMGLISVPEELSENDRMMGHKRVYTRELLRSHLSSAGYSVVREGGVGMKPLPLSQMDGVPHDVAVVMCAAGDIVPDYPAYITAVAGAE